MAEPSIFTRENPLTVLHSIVDTAIDGIILINPEGTILMINPAGCRLFGYEKQELEGINITTLMPSPHRENHHQYIHHYLETGHPKIIGIGREIEGKRKDGSQFPARLAVSEMRIKGEKFFTGIIQDLTAVKNAENEILQLNKELEALVDERTLELQATVNLLLDTNAQLQDSIVKHKQYEAVLEKTRDELHKSLEKEKELSNLKTRFISLASHEFKTPLSSILSSAALIARYTQTEQEEDRTRHIDRIKDSVHHLNAVLSDFLSVTRLDEGEIAPSISRFDLIALIDGLRSEVEGMLKPGQQIICQHRSAELIMESDKGIIRNILYNLLSNAMKYSPEGKTITCVTSSADDGLTISIHDEGMGIPNVDLRHIGLRFFRASNAVNVPGTGLGLNIVMSYLHVLNGRLDFQSTEGEGSTFSITIPIQYEKQNPDH